MAERRNPAARRREVVDEVEKVWVGEEMSQDMVFSGQEKG